MEVKIEQSWKDALSSEFGKPYFESMVRLLHSEKSEGKVIYPPGSQIFRAFDLTPLDKVKVVILGQDPYHGPGQAMGLSFSVPDNVPAPPSLKNIFKEIESDLGIKMSGHHNLEGW
ncbi:MAG: uracil-DNA glycosylase, partial [Bacteroidales bacterium]|nr:uracil-DNA glycosylase [Bacteroidales bacterium]